jgi:hypothetical protein
MLLKSWDRYLGIQKSSRRKKILKQPGLMKRRAGIFYVEVNGS